MAYDRQGLFVLIKEYVVANPSLSLAKLAQLTNVERHTIEKSIKILLGMTFREFRAEILVKQAQRLLLTCPNESIKEIAFKLGYDSPRSFCRFVKANTGRSPREMRKAATQI